MVAKYPAVLLRKVDLTQRRTPASKQATEEFRVEGIPFLKIFGKDGKALGEVPGPDIQEVEAAVKKGL